MLISAGKFSLRGGRILKKKYVVFVVVVALTVCYFQTNLHTNNGGTVMKKDPFLEILTPEPELVSMQSGKRIEVVRTKDLKGYVALIIPGTGGWSGGSFGLMEELVKQGFSVIAPSLLGQGLSSGGSFIENVGAIEFLTQYYQLESSKTIVIGHSQGCELLPYIGFRPLYNVLLAPNGVFQSYSKLWRLPTNGRDVRVEGEASRMEELAQSYHKWPRRFFSMLQSVLPALRRKTDYSNLTDVIVIIGEKDTVCPPDILNPYFKGIGITPLILKGRFHNVTIGKASVEVASHVYQLIQQQ